MSNKKADTPTRKTVSLLFETRNYSYCTLNFLKKLDNVGYIPL